MKLKITLFIFIASFILLNLNILYGIEKNNYNLNNYFRIHVVANSDNINDQILKLKISNAVNEYIKELTAGVCSKDEYTNILKDNIYNILNVANMTQKENNSSYPLAIHFGKIKYDDKKYNNIQMDKGTYNSLRIVIGNGIGNNWWSLLYPSIPQDTSTEETLNIDNVQFKSKILEWINMLFI